MAEVQDWEVQEIRGNLQREVARAKDEEFELRMKITALEDYVDRLRMFIGRATELPHRDRRLDSRRDTQSGTGQCQQNVSQS